MILVMLFPMKIQPIDFHAPDDEPVRFEPVKPVVKSRFKRLFERQFTSVLRISSPAPVEKAGGDEVPHFSKSEANNGSGAFEPSSVCLANMVQNFIEGGGNEKQLSTARCGRNRCNCFHGSCNDSSEDDDGSGHDSNSAEGCEILKVINFFVH